MQTENSWSASNSLTQHYMGNLSVHHKQQISVKGTLHSCVSCRDLPSLPWHLYRCFYLSLEINQTFFSIYTSFQQGRYYCFFLHSLASCTYIISVFYFAYVCVFEYVTTHVGTGACIHGAHVGSASGVVPQVLPRFFLRQGLPWEPCQVVQTLWPVNFQRSAYLYLRLTALGWQACTTAVPRLLLGFWGFNPGSRPCKEYAILTNPPPKISSLNFEKKINANLLYGGREMVAPTIRKISRQNF